MKVRAWSRVGAALAVVFAIGCGGSMPLARQREASRTSVEELRGGHFATASAQASAAIAANGRNATARLVRATARWVEVAQHTYGALFARGRARRTSPEAMRAILEHEEEALGAVAEDLEIASGDESIELELCVACWRVDWNQDGAIDADDEHLLEIELDADGRPIPEGDPRRRPTFRFDVGDVWWARSMVAFQRAAIDGLLAYRFEDLESDARGRDALVLRIADASRLRAARRLVLEGLDEADHARTAYLAETDDDREWVPNPRQASHPLPLPVDDALYDTWKNVLVDVRRLVEGEEGLDVGELVRLSGVRAKVVPRGFVDVGRLFAEPRDLSIDERVVRSGERDPDAAIRSVLGDAYVRSMKPSPLPRRLARMQGEIDRGEESLARKLRYLFWLN
jgi:hypothetical protein